MIRQRLSQKLLQKLSPQQIQLMKLLQVPTALLEQRIKDELEANPALEEGNEEKEDEFSNEESSDSSNDELDVTDYLPDDDDMAAYKMRSGTRSKSNEEDNKTIPIPVTKTFHEHLEQQLSMYDLNEKENTMALQLIGSIDEDGYLRREIEAISDDLAFSQNIFVEEEDLQKVLEIIKSFDPVGVGAKNLQECLLLQLKRKENNNKAINLAIEIIENYFDEFAKKHYDKLMAKLDINDDDLKEVIEEIVSLNPKPASGYSEGSHSKSTQYVIPDFTILNNSGDLEIILNSKNAPELMISESYKSMLTSYAASSKKDKEQKKAVQFIKQKIDAAQWFIDAIRQRQATLMATMGSILEFQYEYFLTGDETKLKPMILKDIAEMTDLDISTISRVTSSKYVQTEFGTYLLKYFFSESLQMEDGEEVSTKEVKSILSDFVNNENKKKPYSDQKLMDMLKEKGYNIARRTVAKYREQLNIPVARLRKEL